MKDLVKKVVLLILQSFAKIKLKRMRAKIIGITGSVGKTTCKEMIYSVLQKKYRVLKSKKSYNTEFGLLLTILHQESGFSSASQWLKILIKSFVRTFFVRDKYDYLVLEMGVDKPGDMDFLTSIAPPDISVITAIKPVHLDAGQFVSVEDIFEEKRKIFTKMKKNGTALINMDDNKTASVTTQGLQKLTYGTNKKADFDMVSCEQKESGLEFTLEYKERTYSFKSNLYGEYHASLMLPAIIVGFITNIPTGNIFEAVRSFNLPPGRMSLIEGKKGTLILDSSYNASPYAIIEALKILDFFAEKRNKRRVFVFGNMNELGEHSKELHTKMGAHIAKNADVLITVGEDVLYAASASNKEGMPSENIYSFKSATEAVNLYKKIMQNGDIVLVKGSQNKVYLEIFVKEIMAKPELAKEKLVRQEKKWKDIKP